MSGHIDDIQIIRQDGRPVFAVIPYDDFLELTGREERESNIPHAVVGLVVKNDWNMLKAWRKHLGLSQNDLAARVGISQPALSQMERTDNLRNSTMEKLARALGISPDQLVD
jgi:DNA-binding Xre family transcriptional regulator